jgi:hypothetical protein
MKGMSRVEAIRPAQTAPAGFLAVLSFVVAVH